MSDPYDDLIPPDLTAFEILAEAARAALPDAFRATAMEVVLRIEDFPSNDMLSRLAIDDPFALTGLYEGIPLTEKSIGEQPLQPDAIWLFRRPILDEWAARGDVPLGALVTHVLVHELAHHFGWSDEDIAKIDPWWL
ncbi:MAG: metallopeptidase family protein [Pseudomonadota bacterium]